MLDRRAAIAEERLERVEGRGVWRLAQTQTERLREG